MGLVNKWILTRELAGAWVLKVKLASTLASKQMGWLLFPYSEPTGGPCPTGFLCNAGGAPASPIPRHKDPTTGSGLPHGTRGTHHYLWGCNPPLMVVMVPK